MVAFGGALRFPGFREVPISGRVSFHGLTNKLSGAPFGWCRGGPWEFDAEKNVPSLQVLRGKNLPAKISAKC